MRSTVAASALSPRSARPCSISSCGSASSAMRWQVCALAAEVVGEAFAIGGLREHAREREFADAARAGEEQACGTRPAAQSAAECGDDAFVAEKFGEGHG